MEKEISDRLIRAAEKAHALAEALDKASQAGRNGREELLKRMLADTPQSLGEIVTHLGRLFPEIYHRPFQFTIATGQYNPEADADKEEEYPDEPAAHFTLRLEHAIRVIGGSLPEFEIDHDNLPDILFERQTVGKWLMFCSHQNSDPACVLEINDDRSTEIYDVNYWAGNVRDRRGHPSHIVALGNISDGWQFIGPFLNEDTARAYANTFQHIQVLPLDPPQRK